MRKHHFFVYLIGGTICIALLVLVLSLVLADSSSALHFEKGTDGTYVVSVKDSEREKITSVEIPSEYNGCAVTAIADEGFLNCTNLEAVRLPDTLKHIGRRAFSNTAIQKITIPDSVDRIAAFAFMDTERLDEVRFEGAHSWDAHFCVLTPSDLDDQSSAAGYLSVDYVAVEWRKID